MRVVFDTNIVASAMFWRGNPLDCLRAWADNRCEAAVSPQLVLEYDEVAEELRLRYPDRTPVEWANALAQAAHLVFPVQRATGATPDPGDDMVLECAEAAAADFIVTGDKTHLLKLGDYKGIRIVSAADFLQPLASRR